MRTRGDGDKPRRDLADGIAALLRPDLCADGLAVPCPAGGGPGHR
ncbi:hypothetical protein RB200_06170 [Streptomyces sp. PmtG]